MSGAHILIHGGRVIDPASGLDEVADLYVAGGRIAGLGRPPEGFLAEINLDASGLVVCPGLIDLAARVGEPGREHKGNIVSETRAAAAGGITTLACPPDTDPVIDTPAVVELIRGRAEAAGQARVLPIGALTQGLDGQHLAELAALQRAGCTAVGNALRPLRDAGVQRAAMEYAATFGLSVFLHPEEASLAAGGCAHEGPVATRLGLPAIPSAAETVAVARDIALIEQTGVRAHFCRLTTGRAAQMLGRAQYQGAPLSADVAVTHLFLTDHDLMGFNAQCHLRPVLRSSHDREALRQALARGTIAALTSDHTPHEPDAKLAPLPVTEAGASGLDTLLGLGLRLVEEGVLTLPMLIERLTLGPARVLRLEGLGLGALRPDGPADVCVFDPAAPWMVRDTSLHSRGGNSPFLGWELPGRAVYTLLGGRLVYRADHDNRRPWQARQVRANGAP